MRKPELIHIMSELGAGTRGASMGFDALKMASIKAGSEYFKKYPATAIETENHLLLETNDTPHAIRIKGIARMYDKIEAKVAETLQAGTFPLIIAADHANAGGTIAGIKKAWPEKRLGVVWIDAHADLHSPYTTPSGNVHGMPLATATSEDNPDQKINDPDAQTKAAWEHMKGSKQRLRYEDLVLIGVRDTEAPEDYLMDKNQVKNIPVEEVRRKGGMAIAREVLEYLGNCDIIYISFDVDSMDPSISVGTGTPVPGGLTANESAHLINTLMESPKICCFEMVEINPLLDLKGNAMAETAFGILEQLTDKIK